MPESSLYERLGGAFAIAAVIDRFSDALIQNPIVGQRSANPALREWHTDDLGRLPGLKFMRTLWVCDVAGGPFQFSATKPGSTALGLEEGRKDRPCVVILAVQDREGEKIVTVAPVTHSPPATADHAVEMPLVVKQRLGLDDGRSWVVTTELNSNSGM